MTRRIEGRAVTGTLFLQQNAQWISGPVLDVGSGSKPFARMFPKIQWDGLDKRPVADIEADFHAMPVADGEYATVICIDALQFAERPSQVVQEMARVVRPGGAVLVLAPDTDPDIEGAFWGFRRAGLRLLLEQAGLEVRSVEASDSTWGGPVSGYLNDFLERDNTAKPNADELKGWAGQIDKLLPGTVSGVAVKSL